jgi:hypothetical protein
LDTSGHPKQWDAKETPQSKYGRPKETRLTPTKSIKEFQFPKKYLLATIGSINSEDLLLSTILCQPHNCGKLDAQTGLKKQTFL